MPRVHQILLFLSLKLLADDLILGQVIMLLAEVLHCLVGLEFLAEVPESRRIENILDRVNNLR